MQMPLASLFQGECFFSGLQGITCDAVFSEMVTHLVTSKRIPSDLAATVVQSLTARESKLTTAIGDGLAVPHASIHGLPHVVAMAGKHTRGLQCAAPDGQPVFVFLMVLVPSTDYAAHLRTLALIGKFLSVPGNRQKLIAVQTREELLRLVRIP